MDLRGHYSKWTSWTNTLPKPGNLTQGVHPAADRAQRGSAARLPPARIAALVDGYQAGATVYELADRFGIHRTSVSANLHRAGVPMRRQGMGEQQKTLAVVLYNQGWSIAHLSDRFDVDPTTVRRALHAQGITLHRGHP